MIDCSRVDPVEECGSEDIDNRVDFRHQRECIRPFRWRETFAHHRRGQRTLIAGKSTDDQAGIEFPTVSSER